MRKPRVIEKDPQEEFRLARPAPSKRNYVPTPEEWAAWCSNPVSEWVAAAHAAKAEECHRMWTEQSWNTGTPDPALLVALRAQAQTFRAFIEANYGDYVAATKTP